jgi:hypothetical protein
MKRADYAFADAEQRPRTPAADPFACIYACTFACFYVVRGRGHPQVAGSEAGASSRRGADQACCPRGPHSFLMAYQDDRNPICRRAQLHVSKSALLDMDLPSPRESHPFRCAAKSAPRSQLTAYHVCCSRRRVVEDPHHPADAE